MQACIFLAYTKVAHELCQRSLDSPEEACPYSSDNAPLSATPSHDHVRIQPLSQGAITP
jgi:hypothetical protein